MDFRLTYAGQLLGTGNKPRPEHVHEIRRHFHKQLRSLWDIQPTLSKWPSSTPPPSFEEREKPPGFKWETRSDELAFNFTRMGYRFVPLVTEDMLLACGLEILFLRQDGPILQTGDIDGRLKTLFDALTMPRHAEQLRGYEKPGEGEDPFYCLLEDDSLVSKVSVETDILLDPTNSNIDRHDSRLVITVRVKPELTMFPNLHFI